MLACCTADVLVDVAAQACAGVGLGLSDFLLEEACDGGHLTVSYQCCKAPAAACSERSAALEVCVGEDILMTLAEQWCGESGQSVVDFQPGDACDEGGFHSLSTTCCSD